MAQPNAKKSFRLSSLILTSLPVSLVYVNTCSSFGRESKNLLICSYVLTSRAFKNSSTSSFEESENRYSLSPSTILLRQDLIKTIFEDFCDQKKIYKPTIFWENVSIRLYKFFYKIYTNNISN